MKILLNFFAGFALFFFTATCNDTTTTGKMEITGTIEQQGITSYQYGTHTLTNEETFYALKSETVNLDDYLDREVTVVAEKIEGYPVDGGPDYLLVLELKE
ncbi:hypothetical protein [Salinimicrobium flavum]|uniref:DUF4377 domain-containing protein n=1 Tax=Salinimicrobium flavum TaxID=1737065 RepID=A0ABW5IWZ6_9FLAO